jgi:uncharacterized SAM-binding protein YcdF (DUF218 family)
VSSGDSRRRSRTRRFLLVGSLLLIAAVIAGLPIYVRPQVDSLRPADAIFVLGGYGMARYQYGLDLQAHGWAPFVVVSNPNGPDDHKMTRFCAAPHADLQCFEPEPDTTKGEAQELRRLATRYGWRTVIVVTFRPHISRARFILEQCFDGELIMAASPAHMPVTRWAFEYAYQTAGYVRAVVQPAC